MSTPVGHRRTQRLAPAIAVALVAIGVMSAVAVAAVINGNNAPNNLAGTAMNDEISLRGDRDRAQGNAGNDRICGQLGNDNSVLDALRGNAGDDNVVGGSGNDRLQGDAGNDTLIGDGGDGDANRPPNDPTNTRPNCVNEDYTETGSAGRDTIRGGPGDDTIRGGAGDDTIFGDDAAAGSGNDDIDAGTGDDFVFARGDGKIDAVDCGAGDNDQAQADANDTNVGNRCEEFGNIALP